jgi:putative transposase
MKYRPDFPARFGCIEDGCAHGQIFFAWYNAELRHSGIAYAVRVGRRFNGRQELRVRGAFK